MSNASTDHDLQPCPCCDSRVLTMLGGYEVCEVCGREDDPIQTAESDYAGGANKLSLNQARMQWAARTPKS